MKNKTACQTTMLTPATESISVTRVARGLLAGDHREKPRTQEGTEHEGDDDLTPMHSVFLLPASADVCRRPDVEVDKHQEGECPDCQDNRSGGCIPPDRVLLAVRFARVVLSEQGGHPLDACVVRAADEDVALGSDVVGEHRQLCGGTGERAPDFQATRLQGRQVAVPFLVSEDG